MQQSTSTPAGMLLLRGVATSLLTVPSLSHTSVVIINWQTVDQIEE